MNNNRQMLYFVKQGDSLWKIVEDLFGTGSNSATAYKVREIAQLNPHLTSPDHLMSGQLLYLGGDSCPLNPTAYDLGEAQMVMNENGATGLDFMCDNFDALQWLGEEFDDPYGPGFLNCVNMSPYSLASQLGPNYRAEESTFKKIMKPLAAASELTLETIQGAATGKFGLLKKIPNDSLRIVEGELLRGISRRVRHLPLGDNVRTLVPKGFRALQGNGKVLMVNPGMRGFADLSKSLRQTRRVGHAIEKFSKINIGVKLGIIGTVAEVAGAGMKISDHWGTPQQGETVAREVTKSTVSIAGGLATSAVAGYAVVAVATGPIGIAVFITVVVGGTILTNAASNWAGEGAAEVYNGSGRVLSAGETFGF